MRLPPFPDQFINKTDDELGKSILGWWFAAQAEEDGIDPLNIPREYAEWVRQRTLQLPDDHASCEDDSLFLAIKLAANGEFEAAGKKLKEYFHYRAEFEAMKNMLSRLSKDTEAGIKVRRSAVLGHEAIHGNPVEKETKRRQYLDLIDEIRRKYPRVSNRKIHEIAEAESESIFGVRVSYKTFERAEKKEKS